MMPTSPLVLGMPLLLELDDFLSTVSLCQQLGLDFIELNTNFPQFQLEDMNLPDMRQILREAGIFCTLHLDETANPFDFSKTISSAYQTQMLNAIRVAQRLEIPLINIHFPKGVFITLPDKRVFLYEKYKELFWKSLERFRISCEEAIGGSGILISIENTNGYETFQQNAIDFLLESKVFSLTWDIGHDYCTGYADTNFIHSRLPFLTHIHLHDAKDNRSHLPLGEGRVDLRKVLSIADSCKCRTVLEVKTVAGLQKSMALLQSGRL